MIWIQTLPFLQDRKLQPPQAGNIITSCSAAIHTLLSHFSSWEGLPFPVQVTTRLASPWLTWRCPVSCVLAPGLCFRSGPTLARHLAVPQGLGFQLSHCSSSPQTMVSKKKKHNYKENILCSVTWSVTPALLPNIVWPHHWLYPTNSSWKWLWPIGRKTIYKQQIICNSQDSNTERIGHTKDNRGPIYTNLPSYITLPTVANGKPEIHQVRDRW